MAGSKKRHQINPADLVVVVSLSPDELEWLNALRGKMTRPEALRKLIRDHRQMTVNRLDFSGLIQPTALKI